MRKRSRAESDAQSFLSSSSSSRSSCDDFDEDDVNVRVAPNWCAYRELIGRRGCRLDTCRDVKEWYQRYWDAMSSQGQNVTRDLPGYARACNADENELCKDAGLPENLFRGTWCATGMKVVIKAVHLLSREYDVIRYLSSPRLRPYPMNHTIPVLDLIEVPKDSIGFVVMEEWSPELVSNTPCNLRQFLGALRQCIEHIVFMHSHHIAHGDISIRNILQDFRSHYAYIDFELSRRFDRIPQPRIHRCRGAELPPELERGEWSDPYKADVWALAILMLQACKMAGFHIPELLDLVQPMLHERYEMRPTANAVLKAFENMTCAIGEARLQKDAASC